MGNEGIFVIDKLSNKPGAHQHVSKVIKIMKNFRPNEDAWIWNIFSGVYQRLEVVRKPFIVFDNSSK